MQMVMLKKNGSWAQIYSSTWMARTLFDSEGARVKLNTYLSPALNFNLFHAI
jgi:hypothetical protein